MLSRRRRLLDAIGVALAISLVSWAALTAIGKSGARPAPFVEGVLLAMAAFATGRRLAQWRPATPCVVVGAVGLLGVIVGRGQVTHAGGQPLGYANANAALFGLAALAMLIAVVGAVTLASRPVAIAAASTFIALTVATRSIGGVVALTVGALIAVAGRRFAGPLAVAVVVLVLAITAAIAVGAPQDGRSDVAVRTQLWHEAVRLLRTEPVHGIGVGRFEVVTTVTRDRDLRWAHNDYLQLGAELGAVGFVLALLLLGWTAFELLIAARLHQPLVSWGAGALACTGVHASVDYVLHFPVVIALTALLVGAGTSHPHQRSESRGSLLPHR